MPSMSQTAHGRGRQNTGTMAWLAYEIRCAVVVGDHSVRSASHGLGSAACVRRDRTQGCRCRRAASGRSNSRRSIWSFAIRVINDSDDAQPDRRAGRSGFAPVPDGRSGRVDQSGRADLVAEDDAAADGAEPGAGRLADDHLFRADHRGAGPVAPGARHAATCRPAR